MPRRMTQEQLQGMYAKFAWTRVHFDTFDAEIAAWLKNDAHRILYERNEDMTQHSLRAEFKASPGR